MITVDGSYNNFESLEAVFDDFNQIYPNVILSFVKPDDYNNMISTILEGNDAPNIYFMYSWMQGREAYANCYVHAEDLSDPAFGFDLDIYRPSLLSWNEDGTLSMAPVFATTYGMLVNDDIFQKEGLEVPTTYSELLSVCEALKAKGYDSPMMGYMEESNSLVFALMYPQFCGSIADDPEAIEMAGNLDPEAGEYMRPVLETMMELIDKGCIDLDECAKIEDGYTAMILRFFEGDVPMMICSGDTVSGTKKRESQSEAFTASPFSYSFAAIPTTEEGAYLVDTASVQFAVNKDCDDLEMTNEFMRFLLTYEELNKMSELKRLVTPTKDLSYDSVYAKLGSMPAERIISPEALHITDDVSLQFRAAVYRTALGELTVDEAVQLYGTFEKEQ